MFNVGDKVFVIEKIEETQDELEPVRFGYEGKIISKDRKRYLVKFKRSSMWLGSDRIISTTDDKAKAIRVLYGKRG